MNRDDAINVAKKLKALAEKSTGGEQSSATEKLKSFCAKHNLDPEDYSIDVVHATIPYTSEHERIILSNVLCLVMEVDQVKGTVKNSSYNFDCTPRQLENIQDAFLYYKKLFYDYVDELLVAMVSKNEIGNKKKPAPEFKFDEEPEDVVKEDEAEKKESTTDTVPPRQPSEQEVKKNERMAKLFMAIESSPWKPKTHAKFLLS